MCFIDSLRKLNFLVWLSGVRTGFQLLCAAALQDVLPLVSGLFLTHKTCMHMCINTSSGTSAFSV